MPRHFAPSRPAPLPLFAILFVSFFVFPLVTCAQQFATIAGNVYYGNEQNVARNVSVSLSNNEHQLLESQMTTDAGQFRFGMLKRSVYTITVNADGFERYSQDIDVSLSSDKIISVYLTPLTKNTEVLPSQTVSAHELSMPAKARNLVESGRKKLYQDKNAQAALPDFQQALGVAPNYYEAVCLLAMAQLTLGNSAAAESSFRNSIDISGKTYAEAYFGLGAVLLDRGELSEADSFIRHGLQLNPNLWVGHYELSRDLFIQHRVSDALASAEEARLLAPSAPIVYRLLSNIHLLLKDYPALLADLDSYVSLDPNSPAGLRAKQLRAQLQQKFAAPPRPTLSCAATHP